MSFYTYHLPTDTCTDDYGDEVYFSDSDGEPMKECCVLAHPHGCGDCLGGTEADPYVNGNAYGWRDMPTHDTLTSMVGR